MSRFPDGQGFVPNIVVQVEFPRIDSLTSASPGIAAQCSTLPMVTVSVTVEGDLDLRGTLGTPDVPVGFTEIRLLFDVQGDIAPERLEKLKERTEKYCVVLQTLLSAPTIAASWDAPAA